MDAGQCVTSGLSSPHTHIMSIFNAPLRVLPIGRDSYIILYQSCVKNYLLLALKHSYDINENLAFD